MAKLEDCYAYIDVKEMYDYYAAGASLWETGQHFVLGVGGIKRLFAKYGDKFPLRRPGNHAVSEAQRREYADTYGQVSLDHFRRLVEQGYSVTELAQILNQDRRSIQRRLRRWGLTCRDGRITHGKRRKKEEFGTCLTISLPTRVRAAVRRRQW